MHRVAHRDAVGVALVEPSRVERADQRARAEEGRLVALAFLLGERDDLDAERQAPPGAVQFANARHRNEDAEPAVVLAAVANRVVVRTGEQPLRTAVAAVVDADDVADRVDVNVVESAVLHPALQAVRARAVRRRQVGHGQLAALLVAGVALGGERLGPVPHEVAELGRDAELVGEPDLCDAMDVAQALGKLEVRMAFDAAREAVDDLRAREPRAARPAHREDEREAEFRVVVGVELRDARELLRAARAEPGLRLLAGRLGRQRPGERRLAREFGVGANERELCIAPGAGNDRCERVLELREARERPRGERALDDPRRVFVQAVERGERLGGRCGVEPV